MGNHVDHEFAQSQTGRGVGRAGGRRLAGDRVQLIGQFRCFIGLEHADHGGLGGAEHADGAIERPRFVARHRVRVAERGRLADRR